MLAFGPVALPYEALLIYGLSPITSALATDDFLDSIAIYKLGMGKWELAKRAFMENEIPQANGKTLLQPS